MAGHPLPPLDRLRQLLDYDPETGSMTWRPRAIGDFPSGLSKESLRICNRWNARYAGKRAGSLSCAGYIQVHIDGRFCLAHRVAWKLYYGRDPSFVIDHRNRNRSDNRVCNLRDVSKAENCRNSKLTARNTSGYHGVAFDKRKKGWRVTVNIGGNSTTLGCYASMETAIEVRRAAEKVMNYDPSHGRAPCIV